MQRPGRGNPAIRPLFFLRGAMFQIEPIVDKRDMDAAIAEAMKDAEFPDLKAILCEFMSIAGGAKGVARMLKREYLSAKKGSMIRSMILQMILQGAKSVSVKEGARDASLISDDDIDRELKTILNAVPKTGQYGGPTGLQPPA